MSSDKQHSSNKQDSSNPGAGKPDPGTASAAPPRPAAGGGRPPPREPPPMSESMHTMIGDKVDKGEF